MLTQTTCFYPSCPNPYQRQGFCESHWNKWREHTAAVIHDPVEVAFFSRVSFGNAIDECWLWTGKVHRKYGAFNPPRTRVKLIAHRWAYEYLVGPIPEGLQLDHLCCQKLCVSPFHLEPVTLQENLYRAKVRRRGLAMSNQTV